MRKSYQGQRRRARYDYTARVAHSEQEVCQLIKAGFECARELFALAKNLADRVAKSLMMKYGCKLSEGEVCRGYELKVDDPVARLLSRYFCVSTPERKIDHSPGINEGELEHFSRDAAVEYLLMPERVKKLEGQVLALHVDLEELTGTLKKLFSIEGSGEFGPEQRRLLDYVS